jgi:hypothetical protein
MAPLSAIQTYDPEAIWTEGANKLATARSTSAAYRTASVTLSNASRLTTSQRR